MRCATPLLSLVEAEGDPDGGTPDDPTMLGGDPLAFGDGAPPALTDAPSATHSLVARVRRRFLGDDAMIHASGRAWPICLANGAWWTFEIDAGDSLNAARGVLLREALPLALGWRGEGGGRSFAPYFTSTPSLSLALRPGDDPWVRIDVRWLTDPT